MRCESVFVHLKAGSFCEKATVVLTQSCPASKVASLCPCCVVTATEKAWMPEKWAHLYICYSKEIQQDIQVKRGGGIFQGNKTGDSEPVSLSLNVFIYSHCVVRSQNSKAWAWLIYFLSSGAGIRGRVPRVGLSHGTEWDSKNRGILLCISKYSIYNMCLFTRHTCTEMILTLFLSSDAQRLHSRMSSQGYIMYVCVYVYWLDISIISTIPMQPE